MIGGEVVQRPPLVIFTPCGPSCRLRRRALGTRRRSNQRRGSHLGDPSWPIITSDDRDGEGRLVPPAGLQQRQVRPTGDQGVGRRGHRLEGDHIVIRRRIHLRERISGTEASARFAGLRRQARTAPRLGGQVGVIECPRAEADPARSRQAPRSPVGSMRASSSSRSLTGISTPTRRDRRREDGGKGGIRTRPGPARPRWRRRRSGSSASARERFASNSTSWGNGNAAISSRWPAKSKLAARTPPSLRRLVPVHPPSLGGGQQAVHRQSVGVRALRPSRRSRSTSPPATENRRLASRFAHG